jgi:hypothetical protein
MIFRSFLPALLCGLAATAAVSAAAPPSSGKLRLELNALQPVAAACRVTFLATNDLGASLSKTTFELAIFGKDGSISRIVSADFDGLTAGKTKVLQFDLKDVACTDISRVLVNDVTACTGEGVAPTACLAGLQTSDRTAAAFGE